MRDWILKQLMHMRQLISDWIRENVSVFMVINASRIWYFRLLKTLISRQRLLSIIKCSERDPEKLIRLKEEKVKEILEKHDLFLNGKEGGKQANFNDVDLSSLRSTALFKNKNLEKAKFRGAILTGINFHKSRLQGANFTHCIAHEGASFQEAQLHSADFGKANLYKANFKYCEFQGAKLNDAILVSSNLHRADFSGKASLENADLREADLSGVALNETNITNVRYNRGTQCLGIRLADCHGSQMFRSFAQHQDFVEELKDKHPKLYWTWQLFADCGRTPWRWLFWTAVFICVFALVYSSMGASYFSMDDCSDSNKVLPSNDFSTWLYFSVVTFTTLGFGDVSPVKSWAEVVVVTEVLIGYAMLGGLISIFANLITTRRG